MTRSQPWQTSISEMARLYECAMSALRSPQTVAAIHTEAIEQAKAFLLQHPDKPLRIAGAKNTADIPEHVLGTLLSTEGWLLLTLDHLAPQMAGTDVRIPHPRTGRPMSGSTSGGAVNVLRGIVDVAIGTDIGGSVIAPALSLQLFGVNGKGLGMESDAVSLTSDGRWTKCGVGMISHSWGVIQEGLERWMAARQLETTRPSALRVSIPSPGSVTLPNGRDMHAELLSVPSIVQDESVEWVEHSFAGCKNREVGSRILQGTLDTYDVVLTYEGPIDLYGLGDSRISQFGDTGAALAQDNGRFLLRSTTVSNAIAVGLPSRELGCGYVLQTVNASIFPAVMELCSTLVDRMGLQQMAGQFRDMWSERIKERIPWKFL